MSERKPILPEFPGSVFEGYAVNYITKNFWRIQHQFGDFEDAMSEATIVFYECRRLYGSRVNSLPHFMALFKRMMTSWFVDWGYYDSRQRMTLQNYTIKEEIDPEAPLNAALNEASSELKDVLKLVLGAPAEVLDLLRSDSKSTRGRVDSFFKNAVALCNLPPERAPVLEAELRDILT